VQTPWTDAAQAYARGDFLAAADILDRTGSRPAEAEARLRAAEALSREGAHADADEQLRVALAFYRSVGATRYVERGEALLAALA